MRNSDEFQTCHRLAACQARSDDGWNVGLITWFDHRGFIYQPGSDTPIELNNLAGSSGGVSVQSVNGAGQAVGSVAGSAVTWIPGDTTATDLNQFTPRNVTLSRGIDINDDGTILAAYVDSSGNVSTYLLTAGP